MMIEEMLESEDERVGELQSSGLTQSRRLSATAFPALAELAPDRKYTE